MLEQFVHYLMKKRLVDADIINYFFDVVTAKTWYMHIALLDFYKLFQQRNSPCLSWWRRKVLNFLGMFGVKIFSLNSTVHSYLTSSSSCQGSPVVVHQREQVSHTTLVALPEGLPEPDQPATEHGLSVSGG